MLAAFDTWSQWICEVARHSSLYHLSLQYSVAAPKGNLAEQVPLGFFCLQSCFLLQSENIIISGKKHPRLFQST